MLRSDQEISLTSNLATLGEVRPNQPVSKEKTSKLDVVAVRVNDMVHGEPEVYGKRDGRGQREVHGRGVRQTEITIYRNGQDKQKIERVETAVLRCVA